jgi:hypothetical protein
MEKKYQRTPTISISKAISDRHPPGCIACAELEASIWLGLGYYSIARDEGRIQSVVHGYVVGGGGDYRWMQTMCPLLLK